MIMFTAKYGTMPERRAFPLRIAVCQAQGRSAARLTVYKTSHGCWWYRRVAKRRKPDSLAGSEILWLMNRLACLL